MPNLLCALPLRRKEEETSVTPSAYGHVKWIGVLKKGHKVEADVLAHRIHFMIANVLHHRRETLADSSVKPLWYTVNDKRK